LIEIKYSIQETFGNAHGDVALFLVEVSHIHETDVGESHSSFSSCHFAIIQYGSLKISFSVGKLFGFNVWSPVWLDVLSEYMAALIAGKEFFMPL